MTIVPECVSNWWSAHRPRRKTRPPRPPAEPSEDQLRRARRVRWVAGVSMTALAAVAAIVSYNNGLFLVRLAGVTGRVAYLYPLLPDALIVISWASVYEARISGRDRPPWAIAGIALGACLTLAMNVGAGVLHNDLQALVDGVVPVVLFVALEILMGLIRPPVRTAAVPEADQGLPCPHGVAATVEEAVRQAYAHERECLGGSPTYVDLAARFGPDRKRVAEMVRPPVPASLNGDGHRG